MAAVLKDVAGSLAVFAAAPRSAPIAATLSGVADAAKMIGLRSVTVMCDEITHIAGRLEESGSPATRSEIDALAAALQAVRQYLNASLGGKLAPGVMLHPVYAELVRHSAGRKRLNRAELFLPLYAGHGADDVGSDAARFIAEISRYQDDFHQALQRYRRGEDGESAIETMRATLVTLESKSPPAKFDVLFALAITCLDIALAQGRGVTKSEEGLLARVDKELADVIVTGDLTVDDATISWFSYVVAQDNAVTSSRARSLREIGRAHV